MDDDSLTWKNIYWKANWLKCLLKEFVSSLSPTQYTDYKAKYEKIMASHEKDLSEKHIARVGKLESLNAVKVGDVCVLRNMKRKHHQGRGEPYFLRDLYEVARIKARGVELSPLFHQSRKVMDVSWTM